LETGFQTTFNLMEIWQIRIFVPQLKSKLIGFAT
jgi:hypothetical protein